MPMTSNVDVTAEVVWVLRVTRTAGRADKGIHYLAKLNGLTTSRLADAMSFRTESLARTYTVECGKLRTAGFACLPEPITRCTTFVALKET